MEIKELHIKNFGKFSDRHFFLKDGINIFYGENEYGKSTIYAFIKAMLFGMERGRGRAALSDEFSRYEPWENPNYYSGVMRFTSGGKTFRLERNFDRYSKKAVLLCEDDGEELSVEDGDLEMLLDGLTKKNFESTISIGQLFAKPGVELAEELSNYASNYYETGSGSLDISKAMNRLHEKKKVLDKERRLFQQKRIKKKELLGNECGYVTKELEKMEKDLSETELELQKLQKSIREIHKQKQKKNGTNKIEKKRSLPFIFTGGVCIFIGLIFMTLSILSITHFGSFTMGSMKLLLLIGIVCLCVGFFKKKSTNNSEKIGCQAEDAEEKILKEQIRKQKWRKSHLLEEKKEKQIEYQNIIEQIEELKEPDEQEKLSERKCCAVELAEKKMNEAVEKMSSGFGEVLNRKASYILSNITDGKYTDLFVNNEMRMSLLHQGRKIPVERVSGGTVEQVYFALRMAVTEILFEEPLPLIFDEAFAFYDDKRLKSTLKWLREQPRQVIIFTCQRREMDIERTSI